MTCSAVFWFKWNWAQFWIIYSLQTFVIDFFSFAYLHVLLQTLVNKNSHLQLWLDLQWLRLLPGLRAFRGRVLWAVVWELLFSTTAKRRKHISSKCTVNWKCSLHMGLRVLRWMGLVRKWQLSTGMPRTSTSRQGLPALLPGHTFWPETIWEKKQEDRRGVMIKG